tara:strand:+ start:492 stop:707 length:216 start_codon:yes stop_codon:yes gene_type:complete
MKYITECKTNKTVNDEIKFIDALTGKYKHSIFMKNEYKKGGRYQHKTKRQALEQIEDMKKNNIEIVYIGKY